MSAIAEGGHVNFVVSDFDPVELDCSVREVPVDGYSPDHAASFGATGTTSGTDACTFLDVVDGRLNCAITNTLDEVTVTVNKTWITEVAGTELVEDVFVTLYCSGHDGAVGSAWINPDHPGEFEVLPDHAGVTCHVEEQPLDGVETDVSDCARLRCRMHRRQHPQLRRHTDAGPGRTRPACPAAARCRLPRPAPPYLRELGKAQPPSAARNSRSLALTRAAFSPPMRISAFCPALMTSSSGSTNS